MTHLVVHNYVHPPARRPARDTGLLLHDAPLVIEVAYARGPFGRVERTTRRYTVADPGGTAGAVSTSRHGPDAVRVALRGVPKHREMLRQGWATEEVSGHNRDAHGVRDAWTRQQIEKKDESTLRNVAEYVGLSWAGMTKAELIEAVLAAQERGGAGSQYLSPAVR